MSGKGVLLERSNELGNLLEEVLIPWIKEKNEREEKKEEEDEDGTDE